MKSLLEEMDTQRLQTDWGRLKIKSQVPVWWLVLWPVLFCKSGLHTEGYILEQWKDESHRRACRISCPQQRACLLCSPDYRLRDRAVVAQSKSCGTALHTMGWLWNVFFLYGSFSEVEGVCLVTCFVPCVSSPPIPTEWAWRILDTLVSQRPRTLHILGSILLLSYTTVPYTKW